MIKKVGKRYIKQVTADYSAYVPNLPGYVTTGRTLWPKIDW